MRSKSLKAAAIIPVILAALVSTTYAAEKQGFVAGFRNFWKNIFAYSARVTEESASVLIDAAKGSVDVVSTTLKRTGEVASGDLSKTKELITEPIAKTAETVIRAGEGVIRLPIEAFKDKQPAATGPAPQAESKQSP
jgi:hypothetical protein